MHRPAKHAKPADASQALIGHAPRPALLLTCWMRDLSASTTSFLRFSSLYSCSAFSNICITFLFTCGGSEGGRAGGAVCD